MGAFITGLIGRAEQQRDKEEMREFQEAKQERDRKRQLVDLAAQQAIQTGQYQALPAVFGELDELGPPPGTPKGMKDPYKQLGVKLGTIFGLRKKQQQQQQQAQQADQLYTQTTGQPPPGAPSPGAPPMPPPSGPVAQALQPPQLINRMGPPPQSPPQMAPSTTPPIPQSRMQGFVSAMQQAKQQGQSEVDQAGEREFQTGRKRGDIEAQDLEARQEQRAGALTKYFQSQGMDEKTAKNEANRVVFGKALEPPKRNVKEIPNIEGSPYGQPGKTGTLEIDLNNPDAAPVFRPTSPKTGADDVAKWAKVYMAKDPRLTPEQAAQKAAAMLIETKQLLPEQRIQAVYDAVRTIPGETGVAQVPTHVRGGGRATTPPLPPSRITPEQPGATSPPANQGGMRVTPYPTGFTPEIKATERTRKDNAEVIMKRGGSAIATINQMSRRHPEWFGPMAGRVQDLEKRFGTADPEIGQLKGAMESLIGFLPSLHGFRSAGILKSWQETLDNPLKNPQLTISTMREVMKAAEELRNTILERNVGPMTATGEEEKAVPRGTGGDLSKVPTQELLKRLVGAGQ